MAPKGHTDVPPLVKELEVPAPTTTRRRPKESTRSTWDARTSTTLHNYYYMPCLTSLVSSDSQDLGGVPLSRYGSIADHQCH